MFYPGKVWMDTDGNPIQAHGGSVHYFNDKYYWYGENKKGCEAYKEGIPWHAGVNCYSSNNLYEWTFEGTVLPVSDNPGHDMYGFCIMDRPHVLYNKKTDKYVMWMKIVKGGWEGVQATGIAISDSPTGPFTYLRSFFPCGMTSGDANFFIENGGGEEKVYWAFNRPHTSVVIADLAEDCLDTTGMYSLHFPQPGAPAAREAPVIVKKNFRYYMITSGTTGYNPNPSEWAYADLIHGPWTVQGNPCVGKKAETSFDSQFASAFELPDKPGCFIGIADRWTLENIEDSRYVWLPLIIKDGILTIHWHEEWDLSIFD
jgi:Glycosyl hydrolases family 43